MSIRLCITTQRNQSESMAENGYHVVPVSTDYLISYMGLTTNPVTSSSFVQPGNQLLDTHSFTHVIKTAFPYYSCGDEMALQA